MNNNLFLKKLTTQVIRILTTLNKIYNKELIPSTDLHQKDLPCSTTFYEHEDKTLTRFDNAYFLYLEQKVEDQKYRDEMEDLK